MSQKYWKLLLLLQVVTPIFFGTPCRYLIHKTIFSIDSCKVHFCMPHHSQDCHHQIKWPPIIGDRNNRYSYIIFPLKILWYMFDHALSTDWVWLLDCFGYYEQGGRGWWEVTCVGWNCYLCVSNQTLGSPEVILENTSETVQCNFNLSFWSFPDSVSHQGLRGKPIHEQKIDYFYNFVGSKKIVELSGSDMAEAAKT